MPKRKKIMDSKGRTVKIDSLREERISDEMVVVPVITGANRLSPIMSRMEELIEVAHDVVDIIEENGRTPLSFSRIARERGLENFVPDCALPGMEPMFDTGTRWKQIGTMNAREWEEVKETKGYCAECPLRKECLAVSMTSPQIARVSKIDRNIPGVSKDEIQMTLSEYLIFGGYTPQERKIVFDFVCDILEEIDEQTE